MNIIHIRFFVVTVLLFSTCNIYAVSESGKPIPSEAPAQAPPAPSGSGAKEDTSRSHPFDDAVKLKYFLEAAKNEAAWELLQTYGINEQNIGQNPFLSNVSALTSKTGLTPSPAVPLVTPHAAAGQGLLSATSVADALGTYIAERFKQEAELYALQQLVKEMKVLPIRPIQAAFPRSNGYLNTLKDREVSWTDWPVLQSSFKNDITQFPDHIGDFIDAFYAENDSSEKHFIITLVVCAGDEVARTGRTPYVLIDRLQRTGQDFVTKHGPVDQTVANTKAGLDALTLFSRTLTKNGEDKWCNAREIEEFLKSGTHINTVDAVLLLLGLSYAQEKDIYDQLEVWAKGKASGGDNYIFSNSDTAKKFAFKVSEAKEQLKSLSSAFERIKADVDQLPKVANKAAEFVTAEQLIQDLKSLSAELCTTIHKLDANINTDTIKAEIDKSSVIAAAIVTLINDAYTKQYPAMIGDCISILTSLETDGVSSFENVKEFIRTNGPFFASIAAATNTSELKEALESYALPPGSYTQKQNSSFTVTLNAYFGAQLGAETLTGNLTGTGVARTRARAGFTAPVGIDLNWGNISSGTAKKSATGSWSLFLPVIDVGAVTTWRLGKGSGEISPVTWGNLLSPGLYGVWTRKGAPFAVMLGGQYGPQLRKVSGSGDVKIERHAVLFPAVAVTFDLPLLNLYTARPRSDSK